MRFRTPNFATILTLGLGIVLRLGAAEIEPRIEPGATRDEVIRAYGQPAGESKLGSREVLSYPQGQITLESGRVVRLEPMKKGPPTSGVRKPVATTPVPSPAAISPGHWFTEFDSAAQEALRRHVPILAVFSGTDNSADGRRFLEEVALAPDFAGIFSADFVFLRADSPSPGDPRWQRFGVAAFPTVLFLSAKGERLAAADFARPVGKVPRAYAIASLREIRAQLALRAEAPPTASMQAKSPDVTSPPDDDRLSTDSLKVGIRSAESKIGRAMMLGIAGAALVCWLLWRTRARSGPYQGRKFAARISDAASGIPTLPEIVAWSKKPLCNMAVVLAESEGYEADRPSGSDGKDFLLTRQGEIQPSVLVCCSAGRAGPVTATNLRTMVDTIAANDLETGWYVSPAGFSNDARAYAAEHKLLLIDGPHLIARIRDLPPFLIPKVQTNSL